MPARSNLKSFQAATRPGMKSWCSSSEAAKSAATAKAQTGPSQARPQPMKPRASSPTKTAYSKIWAALRRVRWPSGLGRWGHWDTAKISAAQKTTGSQSLAQPSFSLTRLPELVYPNRPRLKVNDDSY